VENSYKVSINELLDRIKKELKQTLLQAQIEALGIKVDLTTTKTRFNGERLWFICPNCRRRVGTIYKSSTSETMGCRSCLGLKYKAQRYRGMMEQSVKIP